MRGLLYLLAIAGIVAAQDNQTVHAPKEPPSPLTAEEVNLEAVSGGYGDPTCQAVTTTRFITKPAVTVTKPASTITKPGITVTQPGITVTKSGSQVTITTTCYETTTVHDTTTSTSTSTTTCTVVSRFSLYCPSIC